MSFLDNYSTAECFWLGVAAWMIVGPFLAIAMGRMIREPIEKFTLHDLDAEFRRLVESERGRG